MPTTLRDVAAECGLSLQTVSQVLRGRTEAYRPQTCQHVLEAAARLGYRPNLRARMLASSTAASIGIITRGIGDRGLIDRLRTMTHAARDAGYMPWLINLDRRTDDSEDVMHAGRELVQRGVAGLIIHRSLPISPDARRYFEHLSVPVVYVDWGPPRGALRVRTDNASAYEQIAAHLATLGHRTAAMLLSSAAWDFPEHKVYPIQRALAAHAMTLRLHPKPDIGPAMTLEQAAYQGVRQLLASDHDATALILGNDESAVGALVALEHAGVDVPGQMSVVGFGDLPVAAFARPPLTTVRGETVRSGWVAFELLRQRMEQPESPVESQTIEQPLIVRQSTGPAPERPVHVAIDAAVWRQQPDPVEACRSPDEEPRDSHPIHE